MAPSPKFSPQSRPGSKIDAHKVAALAGQAATQELNFSFKYLDINDVDFKIDQEDAAYFCKLLERKRDLSTMKVSEFRAPRNPKAIRSHAIDFDKTSRKAGFAQPNLNQLGTPWQFGISTGQHGRVHGVLLGNTFYVVWFDPKHKLYP